MNNYEYIVWINHCIVEKQVDIDKVLCVFETEDQ